jgi:hypothetical protein
VGSHHEGAAVVIIRFNVYGNDAEDMDLRVVGILGDFGPQHAWDWDTVAAPLATGGWVGRITAKTVE